MFEEIISGELYEFEENSYVEMIAKIIPKFNNVKGTYFIDDSICTQKYFNIIELLEIINYSNNIKPLINLTKITELDLMKILIYVKSKLHLQKNKYTEKSFGVKYFDIIFPDNFKDFSFKFCNLLHFVKGLNISKNKRCKTFLIQLIPKLISGWNVNYITGSGQTKYTSILSIIYSRETDIYPILRYPKSNKVFKSSRRPHKIISDKSNGVNAISNKMFEKLENDDITIPNRMLEKLENDDITVPNKILENDEFENFDDEFILIDEFENFDGEFILIDEFENFDDEFLKLYPL
jgi:hypothetical protein